MLVEISTLQTDGQGPEPDASGRRHVIVVGGGASGVLLACHLLRRFSDNIKVTLIERNPTIGRGLAYGTANPAHLLNVRAANMSAFADDPDHFWQWLLANRLTAVDSDQFCFVSRQLFGRYIESLLQGLTYGENRELDIVQAECIAIAPTPSGAIARLANGSSISADIVVLATGNETGQTHLSNLLYASPWQVPTEASVPRDGHVVILGAGLTMIDYVQSLLRGGHEGPITAISRHGLLPRPHRSVVPFPIDRGDVPFGADIAELVRWLRRLIRAAEQHGDGWRSVVDGLRPFTQELWQSLSIPTRRRFLRHARSWWDVHRHRMAPEVEEAIADAMTSGQLAIRAGKAQSIERSGSAALVKFRAARKLGYGNHDRRPHRGLHGYQSDPAQHDQSGVAQPVRQWACQGGPIGDRPGFHVRLCARRSIGRTVHPDLRDRAFDARRILGNQRHSRHPCAVPSVDGPYRHRASRQIGRHTDPANRARREPTAELRAWPETNG